MVVFGELSAFFGTSGFFPVLMIFSSARLGSCGMELDFDVTLSTIWQVASSK
jgi:hypothetical protein